MRPRRKHSSSSRNARTAPAQLAAGDHPSTSDAEERDRGCLALPLSLAQAIEGVAPIMPRIVFTIIKLLIVNRTARRVAGRVIVTAIRRRD